jgi:hypothetical protein
MRFYSQLSVSWIILAASSISGYSQVGLNSFFDPLLKVPSGIQVMQTSSHNKMGVNGDASWPQYIDDNGEEVIFDVAGPGCIKQMWGTSFDPAGIMKFYFDGDKTPLYQCTILDFYKGRASLYKGFESLVSYERRGRWGDAPFAGNSFLPVPFNKHLKVTIKGMSNFYHIIYEKYSEPTARPDQSPEKTTQEKESLKYVIKNLKNLKPDNTGEKEFVYEMAQPLRPGTSVPLFRDSLGGGIIREMIIEGDGSEDFFREAYIRMRWDSAARYQVMAPIGIFFGSANRPDTVRSLPVDVTPLPDGRARLVCRFPMPYFRSAEINLLNRSTKTFVQAKISLLIQKDQETGKQSKFDKSKTYFTTMYNSGETIYGHDWLLFEGVGSGWYVGTVQTMMQQHYCEGNEHFYIDGAISPQINGTGSEDYYLACFWPNNDFDTPFGCVVGDIHKEGGGYYFNSYEVPSCYSRFHLEAPIPFYSGLVAKIQHGGVSDIISRYRSLSYVYINPSNRLKQTDYIDVGNSASESVHQYKSTQSRVTGVESLKPEGDFFEGTVSDNGRFHSGGTISFMVAIDPENQGVRLRRLLDQKVQAQKAVVFIDGKNAGTWYWGNENEFLRAYEQDFDIHPDLTRGKSSLRIRLEVDRNFSDLNYKVFSFLPLR